MDDEDLLAIPHFLARPTSEEIRNSSDVGDQPVPDDMPSEEADNGETQGSQPEGIDQNDLKPHPYADMFPLMQDEDLAALVTSIGEDGLEEPIVLFKGEILDGRNRFAACTEAEIEPAFVEYEGDDPFGFVLRKNLYRRHLTASQRAMIAAKMANLKQGGDHKSEDFKASNGGLKIEEAAKTFGVSPKSVERAKAVQACDDDELIKAVENGEKTVSAAAKQITQAAKLATAPISKGEVESQKLLKLWGKTGEEGKGLFLSAIGATT